MPAKPAVILVNPQMGENIGAAARIMANFDLDDLRLVAPRDGWPNEKAEAMAADSGVIEKARVFPDLASAIADLNRVYATTARGREMIKPVMTPREVAGEIAGFEGKAGIVFGAERSGLANDDVAQADAIVSIPVGSFKSLNLAQAVAVLAYECFAVSGSFEPPQAEAEPASKADVEALFAALETALDERGFFFPENKRSSMTRNLRNLIGRQAIYEPDVRMLHGVIKTLTRPPGKR